jgi:tetratricopeptide (TPR) repeat protein/DNA-binding CsgD family transcriptional regulator
MRDAATPLPAIAHTRSRRAKKKSIPVDRKASNAFWEEIHRIGGRRDTDFEVMLETSNAAIERARDVGDIGLEVGAMLQSVTALRYLGRTREMDRIFRAAIKKMPQVHDPWERRSAITLAGMEYVRRRDLALGLEMLHEAMDLTDRIHSMNDLSDPFDEIRDRRNVVVIYHVVAIAYHWMGLCDEALDYSYRALDIEERYSFPASAVIASIITIGSIYSRLRDYAKYEESCLRALALSRQEGHRISIAICLHNLGGLKIHTGCYREALPYLHEALALDLELKDSEMVASTMTSLGDANSYLGDYDVAMDYLRRAWKILEQCGYRTGQAAYMLVSMGRVYQRSNQLEDALDCYHRSLKISERLMLVGEEMEVRELLADLYSKLGDYRKGYEHQKRAMELREQIAGAAKQHAAAAIELRNARLAAKGEQELLKARAENAEHEAEVKTRELSATALQLTQRNEALAALRELMAPHVRQGRGQTKALAAAVLKTIASVADSNTGWSLFEEQFERVHSEFIARLRQRCARLTPTEIRICVLIRLNLSTKQIADVLFTSELTVKKHRGNIRRKLALEGDDNLNAMLISL